MLPKWRTAAYTIISLYISVACGRVTINHPYHPLYVKVGDALNITCTSTERRTLEWVRQTPATRWVDTKIIPIVGKDFITRTMVEEPSGYTESTLIKKNFNLRDRGTYMCRDTQQESSFGIWVTSVTIRSQNKRAEKGKTLTLHCNITGFDSNVPAMEYRWAHKGTEIKTTSERHRIVTNSDKLALHVKKPTRSDAGMYECSFILATNLGPFTITEKIIVDGQHLPNGANARTLTPCVTLSMVYVAVLLMAAGDVPCTYIWRQCYRVWVTSHDGAVADCKEMQP